MIRQLYILFFLTSLLILSFNAHISAQNNACDAKIRVARENYQIGDFEEVIKNLTPCVKGVNTFSKKSYREDAYVLLASTFIARDSLVKARELVSLLIDLNPNFQTRNDELLTFRLFVEEAKRGNLVAKVSSVSKVSENLFEAPASVVLITEEQIKRRGYLDLEALIHDLPGFDISRSNGILYSTIYPRGYRSNNTNRMLLLVDGVEENDLWGNIVYLSRQYPISNVKSVEVIYGPASTIYGPNAYAGVISINTKNPSEYVEKGDLIGVSADVGYGAWQTRYLDATVGVSLPNYNSSISFTARFYESNEEDFSDEYWHDFAEHSLDDPFTPLGSDQTWADIYRFRMEITDNSSAHSFYQTYANHTNAGYFDLNIDANGDSSITLSEVGLNQTLTLENELMSQTTYADKTSATSFGVKAQIGNLKLGWQYWFKEEGIGVWFNDVRQATTNEGQYWSPYSNFFYARYDTRLSNSTTFTSFTRYKVHGYLESNVLVGLRGYTNGSLGLASLMEDTAPSWSPSALTTRSNQMRHETRLIYTHNEHFSLVSGFELRYSAIQDNYASSNTDGTSNAQDHYFFGDFGIYAQARYQKDEFTFTAGLRYDYNTLLDTVGYAYSGTGYGSQFNPRLAVVYHPGDYVFKAIFATAFKDATNFDRYSTVPDQRDLPNPTLAPERVFNYEVSARRFLDEERRSSIEILGYFADYTSVIVTKSVEFGSSTTTQFQNSGFRQVFGVQAWADYRHSSNIGDFYFYGNYTFTAPRDIAQKNDVLTDSYGDTLTSGGVAVTSIRVGDIARHQANLGVNYQPSSAWNINLRSNIVGRRPTGDGTTVTGNQDDFPAYVLFNGTASYTFQKYGLTIQGIFNNILNNHYYSPGLRDADNFRFASALPQNRLNVHLRLRWNMSYGR